MRCYDDNMRTTVRIDDDLLMQLKSRAQSDHLPLNQLLNRIIRYGLNASGANVNPVPHFCEKVTSMGTPSQELDKALALSFALEDEETLRKLDQRK